MTNIDRDTRLNEASSLNEAIAALVNVDPAQRQGFVHDRIMTAITDTCSKNKNPDGTDAFSEAQMAILRDVSHQIVYVLDPINRRRGFFHGLRSDWSHSSSFDKVKVAAAVGVFIAGVISGAYSLGTTVAGFFSHSPPARGVTSSKTGP